jgi:uncharacterized protein (TIGR03118 family)
MVTRSRFASAILVLFISQAALAAGYIQTNLVADTPGKALITDPNLVNPWGLATTATSPFWTANNATSTATIYGGDASGTPFTKNALTVTIPGSLPTGVVANGTANFVITSGAASGPARFIFASITGNIVGWNPNVPSAGSTTGVIAAAHPGHVYTGLAIGNNGVSDFLYAADFANNHIDVYSASYALTTLAGTFTDPTLPAGYAPFNIMNLGGSLYVAYAQVGPGGDEVEGAGLGYVSKFDTNGNFLARLVSNGALDAPWGMAIAPAGFGTFASALIVGNFGDGTLNAFNATTGAFLGTLMTPGGSQIVIDGLWGILFGNGVGGGDMNSLYFSSGPNDETNGLFGKLTFNASASTNTILATSTTIRPTEGAVFSGTVGGFSDADGGGSYTITINWGDLTSSTGVVTPLGGGNFSIQGTHTYAEETTSSGVPLGLTITDTTDSATASAIGLAIVADAPLTATGVTTNAQLNQPFTGVVATFTDADPAGTVGDYTATINWGDATTSPGVIAANGSGGFTVTGTHTYTTASNFVITVTINDSGGATATATSTANLAGAIPALGFKGLALLAVALASLGMLVVRRG